MENCSLTKSIIFQFQLNKDTFSLSGSHLIAFFWHKGIQSLM